MRRPPIFLHIICTLMLLTFFINCGNSKKVEVQEELTEQEKIFYEDVAELLYDDFQEEIEDIKWDDNTGIYFIHTTSGAIYTFINNGSGMYTLYDSEGNIYNTYDYGGGMSSTYGPDGEIYNTYDYGGGLSTTYGPDGEIYNTYDYGGIVTTYGPDGEISTMYY